MVASARTVGVEVLALDSVAHQVLPRGGFRLESASRRNVVGCHRVAELQQNASTFDIRDWSRLQAHALEIRGLTHVGGFFVPCENMAFGGVQRAPAFIASEDIRVVVFEHGAVDRRVDCLLHFVGVRPDITQIHF